MGSTLSLNEGSFVVDLILCFGICFQIGLQQSFLLWRFEVTCDVLRSVCGYHSVALLVVISVDLYLLLNRNSFAARRTLITQKEDSFSSPFC